MYLTPKYTVSYKGVFHPCDIPFEIDGKDREEMKKHGKITDDAPRKVGRPRKVVEECLPLNG